MNLARRLTLRAPATTIRLEGEIEYGMATTLAEALAPHIGRPVVLVINSTGGIAIEGAALAAEVARHGAVTAIGQGIVASAATLPFVAARRRIVCAQCAVMIHDPAAMALGTAADMRKAGDDLDVMAGIYADHYARATGLSAATVRAWMVAETWMTPEEAVALGFAHEIETTTDPQEPARADYAAFRQAPERLIRMAAERGWTAAPNKETP